VKRHKLSSAGWRASSVAAPSVWNSLSDYLRDPALELKSFRRQLKTLSACTLTGTLLCFALPYLLTYRRQFLHHYLDDTISRKHQKGKGKGPSLI